MISAELRRGVRRRAGGYCEYCRIHEDFDVLSHHIDHIIARKHDGLSDDGNLCLACANCSLGKGSHISGQDALSGKIIPLFHPRKDGWKTHFEWDGPILVGRTIAGRVTATVLNINRNQRVALRKILFEMGQFPPTIDA